jgi:thiaminase/transcriptional activator TenA
MKWTEKTWKHSEYIYDKIVQMPFIQELITGELDIEKFKFYIAQDSNYLEHFSRTLSLIAARVHDEAHVLQFIQFAEGAIVVEHALHASYFKEFGIPEKISSSPSCHHYISYMTSQAALAPVEVAIATILPCFWIYKKVGDFIYQQKQVEGNPYKNWINTYAGEEFGVLVEQALEISNEVAIQCTETQQARMTDAFEKACYLEWKFWDSAWYLEGWKIY